LDFLKYFGKHKRMIKYISTRGDAAKKSFTDVLLAGMAPDGGLYVPTQWPSIKMDDLKGLSYTDIAFKVMKPFVGGDIPDDDLKVMIDDVYGKNFTHADVAPIIKFNNTNIAIMELFHGPTIAFKDYALQMLGRLFDYTLSKHNKNVTIVGATSGDTGSAAIEGCYKSKHINIFILYPQGRTSDVQRKQMTTIKADNVHNIAVKGNFDDCQNAVKAMFADKEFREDINLSAINSINWARIMAQIVYYFNACVTMGASDDNKISFAVPTGNFGNVYAAYCAKQMGAPIDKLVVGSNRNDILTRFFETGIMKAQGVEPSLSPSMDIQISSNFERVLFDLVNRDTTDLKNIMDTFKTNGEFDVPSDILNKARHAFLAYRASDDETSNTMAAWHKNTDYLIDPHTAVGVYAAQSSGIKDTPIVALACAHPAKFPDAVKGATNIHPPLPPHLSDLFDRTEYMVEMDNDLNALKTYILKKAT